MCCSLVHTLPSGYWLILCSTLWWWWGSIDPTLPPHTRGPPLHKWSAPFHRHRFCIGAPLSVVEGGQHPPLQGGGAQCVNTVVVAATVTTPTTEIVQLIPDSNTGIALHSQWRCSTCGALLPATSVHYRTPPHWRKTDASQRYRAPPAFHTGIRPHK